MDTMISERNRNPALLCDSNDSVLVIVDMQERLSATMPEDVFQRVVSNCQNLAQAANLLNIPVLVTEQYPQGLGSTLPAITNGLPANTQTHAKTSFSCASNENFNQAIEALDKRQIILVGMEAHVCILQTAIELQQRGYQVFIAEDSICSRTNQHYKNALKRLNETKCIITNFESICFEWLRDSKHNCFKDIAKLLK